MRTIGITILFVMSATFSYTQSKQDILLGRWKDADNNVHVEIYKNGNTYEAKLIWSVCKCKIKLPFEQHTDENNPVKSLRKRYLKDINILTGLQYEKEGYWTNGKIYDANSGKTYSASIYLKNTYSIEVRGYWLIEFFGKSVKFVRV
jgi:uncharacterized protein (DUF2147 family)